MFHVVHLHDPEQPRNVHRLDSVKFHYTKYHDIDELWESMSCIPLNSLYSLDKQTNVDTVLKLASEMIHSFCTMIQHDLFYRHVNGESKYINFLHSNAAFTIQSSPRYIHLNRFQIASAELLNNNQKHKKLLLQAYHASMIVKTLFFSKNKSTTKRSLKQCHENCKLTNYSSRFINLDENSSLINVFHEVYCDIAESKIESFQNLYKLFPTEEQNINETIRHICE